jgi:hypothetical protein
MVRINLTEFLNYELQQLLEFIQLQDDNEYNIALPKKTIAGVDCNFNVYWEYYHAAFAGQELAQISTNFTYTVPCLKQHAHFSFSITIYDKALLCVTLFYLINGVYTHKDRMLGEQYNAGAAQLYEEAFNGKEDTACWGLIWIANLFLGKS